MATLNVIYKIAADISGLQKGVEQTAQATEGLERMAGNLGRAIIGGFSVDAVVRFGRALIDDADALVKMADKTGISLQGLQKFQIAGDDAGNTIDQLTMAVNQMQKRLVGDDASAVAGLQKLGLTFDDIKGLAPDAQFMAIASAIRAVKDPAEQVAVAMAVFGRTGAEILPTIKRGFDDVKDASVGMSDETVKNIDAIGDAFTRMWRAAKGGSANLIVDFFRSAAAAGDETVHTWEEMVAIGEGLTDVFHLTVEELTAIHAPQAQYIANMKVGGVTAAEEAAIIRDLNTQLTAQQAGLKAVAQADEAATTAMKAHWSDVGTLLDRVLGVEALKVARTWMDAVDALGGSIASLSNDDLADLYEAMLAGIDAMAKSGTLTDELSSQMMDLALKAHAAADGIKAVSAESHDYVKETWDAAVALDAFNAAQGKTNDALAKTPAVAQQAAQSIIAIGTAIAFNVEQAHQWNALMAEGSNVGTLGGGTFQFGTVANLDTTATWARGVLNAADPRTITGRRASGGPVMAGGSYMIGERGPELFTPGASGFITPNRGGGGQTIHVGGITINGSVLGSKDEIARAIADALEARTRGSAIRMASGA